MITLYLDIKNDPLEHLESISQQVGEYESPGAVQEFKVMTDNYSAEYGRAGGGAPLYDVNKPPAGITQKVISTENFVTVSVDGKVARVEAIAIDDRKLDEFELQETPQH